MPSSQDINERIDSVKNVKQITPMRKVAGKLKIDLSQYRDLEAFSQFGSDLDPETQQTLNRGERLVETLKQNEQDVMETQDQCAIIYAGTSGWLDRIKTERIGDFQTFLLDRLHSDSSDLMDRIAGGEWEDSTENELSEAIGQAIDDFGPDFDSEGNELEEGESERTRGGGEEDSDEDSDDESRDEESGDEEQESEEKEGAAA